MGLKSSKIDMNGTEEDKNLKEDNKVERRLKLLQGSKQQIGRNDRHNGMLLSTDEADDDDDEYDKKQCEKTSLVNHNDECATDSETNEEYEEYPEMLYCHPTYPNSIFQTLEEMKQLSFHTDLTLSTQSEVTFQAHSLVLAAVSSLVQQIIQQVNQKNEKKIFLPLGPQVSDLGVSAVLEFAYNGTISDLNRGSLAQIQAAALYLGVSRILKLCKEEEERERKKDVKSEKEENNSRISDKEQKKVSLQSIKQLWDERVGCDVEVEAEGRIFSGMET